MKYSILEILNMDMCVAALKILKEKDRTQIFLYIRESVIKKTIRKFADQGKIACQRNHCGWRIFPEPEKVALQVKKLLGSAPS